MELEEIVKDMQILHGTREIVRDSQKLYETGRDSQRKPARVDDSERHAATPWDREG